ncbi:M48 family metalloprotease [Sphingomonas sp. ASV193]|uniref:M48 family metallopeptidase n=1 Tax=Sphingomonas sp. ASV193 TaxID=3144405 RepID=UPI0032E85E87
MTAPRVGRRALLAGGGALGAAMLTGTANARVLPAQMVPLVGAGYRPVDADEKGMWAQMDRVEEEIAGSNLLVEDRQVTAYLKELIGRVGGPAAADFRIYLARVPDFNAMMFPTGFALVYSGLLLRMRDEAQLAGVVGHEAAHFLRKHQIRAWRDTKKKTDVYAALSMLGGIAGGAAGANLGNLQQLAQLGAVMSLLKYSRDMESEADALGIRNIAAAGYDPMAMPQTWRQLIGELRYSNYYRGQRYERDVSLFATHPIPEQRLADLSVSAAEVREPGKVYSARRAEFRAAIAGIRPMLLDDQVKLNDPGGSQYIVETLAQDGWDGPLRFAEAEIWRLRNRDGDTLRAAQGYAAAVTYADAPADAWRWHGLMLSKAGRKAEARVAFERYLALAPAAPDAPFVRQMIAD